MSSWFGSLFGSAANAANAANASKANNAPKVNKANNASKVNNTPSNTNAKVNVVTPLPVPNAVPTNAAPTNASVATPQATVGGRRKSKARASRKSKRDAATRKNRK